MSMGGEIISRMPADEYHGSEGISISRLKELKRSALHYRYRLEHPVTSASMRLGTAAHCAVLEPERFIREFCVWSRRSEKSGNLCPRTGQYWDAFLAENAGKTVITEDEASTALTLSHAVRSDPVAMRYLAAGEPEVVMRWVVDGQARRGRADWITKIDGEPFLVGLKTARDCRPFIFGSAAAKLGYAEQWAFYFDGYTTITGKAPEMIEIVVESAPPHATVVYSITYDIIEQGRENYQELLRQLEQCERSGEWLGPGQGVVQTLSLPTWFYPGADDLSELGIEL